MSMLHDVVERKDRWKAMVKAAVSLRKETEGLTRERLTKGWWRRVEEAERAMSPTKVIEGWLREEPRNRSWTLRNRSWTRWWAAGQKEQ
jgi:hypothetical protein